ncbi:MAG: beta-galactosidase [Candidatus Omnitrophica bacterium]|nr:beta-galactosidase [Candidatus Omnitrophota bacterium]
MKILCLCMCACIVLCGPVTLKAREKETMSGRYGAKEDSPFGVLEFLHWNHSWNNFKFPDDKSLQKALKLMKKAGVGFVRMDFLWSEIEPRQGAFDFSKYDTIVELVAKNGIQILGILHYNTPWAASCSDWNCPPADNSLYAHYAAKVAGRYKGIIRYWEVWNEPDSRIYWSNQDGLKSYCSLLKDTYIALKKANPECKVLNGGLAGGISSVNRLYDNGAKDYFDILNIHIFESPLNYKAIAAVKAYPKLARKIMARNGDTGKPIWVTEIGCPGVKRGLTVNNWWMGKNPDERTQAAWVKDVYTALLNEAAVEKVFWAFFRDCDTHWDNGIDYFGLIRWDYSAKPAFFAYKRCVSEWERAKRRKPAKGL